MACLCATCSDAYATLVEGLSRRAERDGTVAVVPRRVLAPLPVGVQAKFLVANNMTQTTSAALRRLQGGSVSGLASRDVMRAGLKSEYNKRSNIVTSSEAGATPASVRSALEAKLDRLWTTGAFVERDISGKPSSAVIAIFGMDTGGAQSTCKAVLGCANQKHQCHRENAILFGAFPCRKDDYETQATMTDLFFDGIEDLRTMGVSVGGQQRPVYLILMGAYSFMATWGTPVLAVEGLVFTVRLGRGRLR